MITIHGASDLVVLVVLVSSALLLGCLAGAFVSVLYGDAITRRELRRMRAEQERARWERMMGVQS